MPLLDFLRTAREPMTVKELWEQIDTMRRCNLQTGDLPQSKSEMERMLRMQRFAGRVEERAAEDGEMRWSVVVERRAGQRELFA